MRKAMPMQVQPLAGIRLTRDACVAAWRASHSGQLDAIARECFVVEIEDAR